MRALVLWRIVPLLAHRYRGVPGPARVEQHAAAERDQVGLAAREDVLGVLGLGDEPDRDGGGGRIPPAAPRERHLIARPNLQLLLRHRAAARGGDVVATALLELLR